MSIGSKPGYWDITIDGRTSPATLPVGIKTSTADDLAELAKQEEAAEETRLRNWFWGIDTTSQPASSHNPYTPFHKCECGTTITMQKDDAPEYHSNWCAIYKLWAKSQGKKK